jgi:hypothetical protein
VEDPYITLKEEDAASDAEDDTLRDSDLIILAARNDDDVSHLEVLLDLCMKVMVRWSLLVRCSLPPCLLACCSLTIQVRLLTRRHSSSHAVSSPPRTILRPHDPGLLPNRCGCTRSRRRRATTATCTCTTT